MAQHLSIRIPWKDNGYNGLVCENPCLNTACLRLANIAISRNDEREKELAGCAMKGHEADLPCIAEGGAFMSADNHSRMTVHPYKKNNSKTHSHFLKTELVYPPFSLPARPFGWTMLRKGNEQDDGNISRLSSMYDIDYDANREPALGFNTNWVQDAVNQRAIFEAFYGKVIPRQSLVIPYAKQVPFIEDAKRVIMGIGFVDSITPPPEHNTDGKGKLRSILWETMIGHSIRNERVDGFMLPYNEMMEYAVENPDFDIRSITVFAEDDYFDEFSFATEHLSYDAVISVLLQSIKALKIIKKCIPGNWDDCICWANDRLAEVWKDRGLFPGVGMMLYAMNFKHGILVAEEVKAQSKDGDSFIVNLEAAISDPKKWLPAHYSDAIGKTERNTFLKLRDERKALFWLLSRFSLSSIQASVLFNRSYSYEYKGKKYQKNVSISCTDEEMLANPYVIYEKTRLLDLEYHIPIRGVDIAVFPPKALQNIDYLPEPSYISSENDERRIRAIAVSVLEQLAENGHTVYPQDKAVASINELPLDPYCSVSCDILSGLESFFRDEITTVETKNGGTAYQLIRLFDIDEVIRQSINTRVNKGKRHVVTEDWIKIINDAFKDSELDESEKQARIEKAAILKELAEARLSVLVGGAGTGKTTLLSLLCKSSQIQNGGVLLLAPTGKARVRMSQTMKKQGVEPDAQTVAQFLLSNNRFIGSTMRYQLSDTDAKDVPNTVIIDECSMLTEEMFGALLQALKKNAQRIILVGDPKQLPPIGAGRPFVDLVRHLKKDIPSFPRVGKSYGELTVTRRQQNEDKTERFDTKLAEWYSDTDYELDGEIFAKIQAGSCGKNFSFKTWKTPEDLASVLFETIAEETGMTDIDDVDGFDISIGGIVNGEWMNFGDKPDMIENWQILSAYRNNPVMGSATINRYIHERYRIAVSTSSNYKKRKTKNPLGSDGIIYGEKVINIRNQSSSGYPKNGSHDYVANGEVGIVERIWQKPKDKYDQHQIRFSSQPDHSYKWYSSVSDEGNSDLELAYALTVHKSQGSEFGTVILIIGEPSGLLSRELMYTALTRQKNKLVILYNADAYVLRNYSSPAFSDIAQRFTGLFDKPNIIEYNKKYYEAGLIHKTARGELVRSKSEVIIADALYDSKISYTYEKELPLGDDGIKIPDFTIENAESGNVYYWEHCGMMSDENYRKRWESKKEVYAKHNIIEGDNLIVSYDSLQGSIDSQEIRKLIEKHLF